MANDATAYYDAGADISGHASVAMSGKRFCVIAATRRAGGPAGISDTGDGNVVVGVPALGARIFGVTSHDVALNGKVNIMRAPKVVPVRAGAAMTANTEVMTNAAGEAVVYTPPTIDPAATTPQPVPRTPAPVGVLLADVAAGADAQVALYNF